MEIARNLTYFPDEEAFRHAEPFSAAVAEDTFVLAEQLADAFDILLQCNARSVSLSDEFLKYVDDLTEQIQEMQPSHVIPTA